MFCVKSRGISVLGNAGNDLLDLVISSVCDGFVTLTIVNQTLSVTCSFTYQTVKELR